MLSIAIFVCQCHQPNTDLVTKNGESDEFSSCVLSTKVGHNFGCHMTPAEFYVSSDPLVHLQVSTEYLSKSCRTVGCKFQVATSSRRFLTSSKDMY